MSQSLHLPFSQVVTWLQGPGSELLKTHQAIGDSMRAAQALQQKHEEIESQHSVSKHTHTHTPLGTDDSELWINADLNNLPLKRHYSALMKLLG